MCSFWLLAWLMTFGGVSCELADPKSWLLMVEAGQENQSRRITPKSVFIAPAIVNRSEECRPGYRYDHLGRCVKVVRVDPAIQLNLLLKRLQASLNSKQPPPPPKPDAGPLHFSIPLGPIEPAPAQTAEPTPTPLEPASTVAAPTSSTPSLELSSLPSIPSTTNSTLEGLTHVHNSSGPVSYNNTLSEEPVNSSTSTPSPTTVSSDPSTLAKDSISLTPVNIPTTTEGSGELEGSGYTTIFDPSTTGNIPFEGSGEKTTEGYDETRNIRSTTIFETTTMPTTTSESIIMKVLKNSTTEQPVDLKFYDIVFPTESSEEDSGNNTVLIPLENIKWNFSDETQQKENSNVSNSSSIIIDGVDEKNSKVSVAQDSFETTPKPSELFKVASPAEVLSYSQTGQLKTSTEQQSTVNIPAGAIDAYTTSFDKAQGQPSSDAYRGSSEDVVSVTTIKPSSVTLEVSSEEAVKVSSPSLGYLTTSKPSSVAFEGTPEEVLKVSTTLKPSSVAFEGSTTSQPSSVALGGSSEDVLKVSTTSKPHLVAFKGSSEEIVKVSTTSTTSKQSSFESSSQEVNKVSPKTVNSESSAYFKVPSSEGYQKVPSSSVDSHENKLFDYWPTLRPSWVRFPEERIVDQLPQPDRQEFVPVERPKFDYDFFDGEGQSYLNFNPRGVNQQLTTQNPFRFPEEAFLPEHRSTILKFWSRIPFVSKESRESSDGQVWRSP